MVDRLLGDAAEVRGVLGVPLPAHAASFGSEPAMATPALPASLAWAVMDLMPHPALVVDVACGLKFANRAAREMMSSPAAALQTLGKSLSAHHASEWAALRQAVEWVAYRRTRMLEILHDGQGHSLPMAVLPLPPTVQPEGRPESCSHVLLMAARPEVCDPVSLEAFARAHGLTPTESRVMRDLADGMAPSEVADALKVEVNTVRSHITHIRTKTGLPSIRHLLAQLARLPPLSLRPQWRS